MQHDRRGNITITRNANSQAYTWDQDNMMISADLNSDSAADATYKYDVLGRRISKTVGAKTTSYAPIAVTTDEASKMRPPTRVVVVPEKLRDLFLANQKLAMQSLIKITKESKAINSIRAYCYAVALLKSRSAAVLATRIPMDSYDSFYREKFIVHLEEIYREKYNK